MKAITDTGLLVAFANRNDRHHEWAIGIVEQISAPLLTCEAVLAETAFHLGSCSIVLEMLQSKLAAIAFVAKDHLVHLEALASRFADRKPDFADICLIRMSELHPKLPVITVDQEDFRIYRRNKREAIPLICPS